MQKIIIFILMTAPLLAIALTEPPVSDEFAVAYKAEIADASGFSPNGEADASVSAEENGSDALIPGGAVEAAEADSTGGPTEEAGSAPAGAGMPAAPEPFAALLPHETIVKNYSELKHALADDNGITTVYFGDNITMQLTGIEINSAKANVIVDGVNPLDPNQKQPYTLTDYNSATFTDTIYVTAGVKTLLVRNLTIKGKNFYGPFSFLDSGSLAGLTVTYEQVNYNGPQLAHHRRGAIRLKNCTVRIHGDNGISANQEFSEAKHVIFEGANTIDTVTSAFSVFWVPGGGTFEIADDSSLTLTSSNTSATFGVFYANGPANAINVLIGNRAVFDATISGVMVPDASASLKSFMIEEGGEFYLKTTKTTAGNVLKIVGALTVERDAKFIISGYGGASGTALRQENGDITVGRGATFQIASAVAYAALLDLAGRGFICNDPASILLYNADRTILASDSAGRLYVSAQQINYWNTLSPDGLDNPPRYKWDKPDKTNFFIDGALDTGTGGNFSSLSSNYTSGDPPGVAPSAASFSMVDARVLSFGRLDLIATAATVRSDSVSGITAPGARVRVSFTQGGADYSFSDVTADAAGVFRVPIGVALEEATIIKVKSNWQYLTATAEVVVRGEGKLEFFVPKLMEFFATEISLYEKTVNRLRSGWEIIVSDTRGAGGGWSMYARLDSEMAPDSADRPALEDSLIYVDGLGDGKVMDIGAEMLVFEHTSAHDEEITPVTWDEDKGILLFVKPGTAFVGSVYSASLSWILVDAP